MTAAATPLALWRRNRLVVARPGALQIELPRSRAGRDAARRRLRSLAPGTELVLCASGAFPARKVRRAADAGGVTLDRQFLAFPSGTAPAYLVEDAPAAVDYFLRHTLVAPPGVRFGPAVTLLVAVLRRLAPVRLVRLATPARVAVGRVAP